MCAIDNCVCSVFQFCCTLILACPILAAIWAVHSDSNWLVRLDEYLTIRRAVYSSSLYLFCWGMAIGLLEFSCRTVSSNDVINEAIVSNKLIEQT